MSAGGGRRACPPGCSGGAPLLCFQGAHHQFVQVPAFLCRRRLPCKAPYRRFSAHSRARRPSQGASQRNGGTAGQRGRSERPRGTRCRQSTRTGVTHTGSGRGVVTPVACVPTPAPGCGHRSLRSASRGATVRSSALRVPPRPAHRLDPTGPSALSHCRVRTYDFGLSAPTGGPTNRPARALPLLQPDPV